MNNVRILSCSHSLKSYKLCISDKVAGFRKMFSESGKGDILYIAIHINGISHCCARAILGSPTDYTPWENPELYPLCHKLTNIEFCKPFSLKILENAPAGRNWGCVYTQGSKAIKHSEAVALLEKYFEKNKCNNMYEITEDDVNPPKRLGGRKKKNNSNSNVEAKNNIDEDCVDLDSIIGEDDNEKINIMGTFKTVKFKNEIDKNRGLDAIVSKNFYNLFNFFEKENSILIPDNKLFGTKPKTPISGIPDALLITFDPDDRRSCLKIHIIEYECYGEGKPQNTMKFKYLNGTIIPQLVRFASNFSIVTDNKIREETITRWIHKIEQYVQNHNLETKIESWLKIIDSQITTPYLMKRFNEELVKAFNNNIKILLIIDELSIEQRDTIKNVISAFKLSETDKNLSIDFEGYVVRLEHLLTYTGQATSQYALSLQEFKG